MIAYMLYLLLTGCEGIVLQGRGFVWKTDGWPQREAKRDKAVFVTLACLEMLLLAALRGRTIGADTETYLRALGYYRSLPREQILGAKLVYPFDFEIGYFMLTKLCAWLGISDPVFLLIIAALIYIPLFQAIYERSDMPYLSILVYFGMGLFAYSLGIFRQLIAMSIVLSGIYCIEERRFCRFLIYIGFAMLFHTTAFVVLPLYFLGRLNTRKWAAVIFTGEFGLLVLGRPVVMLLVKVFPRYARYVGSMYDIQGGTYTMLILLTAVLVMGLIADSRKNAPSRPNRLLLNAMVMAVWLQAISYSMEVAGRLVIYYSMFMIFLIPQLIESFFKGKDRWIAMLLVGLCFLLLACLNLHGNGYVSPYYFFWQSIN